MLTALQYEYILPLNQICISFNPDNSFDDQSTKETPEFNLKSFLITLCQGPHQFQSILQFNDFYAFHNFLSQYLKLQIDFNIFKQNLALCLSGICKFTFFFLSFKNQQAQFNKYQLNFHSSQANSNEEVNDDHDHSTEDVIQHESLLPCISFPDPSLSSDSSESEDDEVSFLPVDIIFPNQTSSNLTSFHFETLSDTTSSDTSSSVTTSFDASDQEKKSSSNQNDEEEEKEENHNNKNSHKSTENKNRIHFETNLDDFRDYSAKLCNLPIPCQPFTDASNFFPKKKNKTKINQFSDEKLPPDPNQEPFIKEIPFTQVECRHPYDYGALLIHCTDFIDILGDIFHRAGTILAKAPTFFSFLPLNDTLKKEFERNFYVAYSEVDDTITNTQFSFAFESIYSLLAFMCDNIHNYIKNNFISANIGIIISFSQFSAAIYRLNKYVEIFWNLIDCLPIELAHLRESTSFIDSSKRIKQIIELFQSEVDSFLDFIQQFPQFQVDPFYFNDYLGIDIDFSNNLSDEETVLKASSNSFFFQLTSETNSTQGSSSTTNNSQTTETDSTQDSSSTTNNSQTSQISSNRFMQNISNPSTPSIFFADGQDPKDPPRPNKNDLFIPCSSSSSDEEEEENDDDDDDDDDFIASLGPKTNIKTTTTQQMMKASTLEFRCSRQMYENVSNRTLSNNTPLNQETLNVIDSFIQFFQELNNDLFQNKNNDEFQTIQRYVIELLSLNPIKTKSEKKIDKFNQAKSKLNQKLLSFLVPFSQIDKQHKKSKKNKDQNLKQNFKNKTEEISTYYMENPPISHMKPIYKKINWKSPSGAALLAILGTNRRFPNELFNVLSNVTGIPKNTLKSKRKRLLDKNLNKPIQSIIEHIKKPKIPPFLKREMLLEIIEALPYSPRLEYLQDTCVKCFQKPENLVQYLRYRYPKKTETEIQKLLEHLLNPESKSELDSLFQASYDWIIRFLDEEGIRLYAPINPTNQINSIYANIFVKKVSDAIKEVGRALVLNLDETSVRITFRPKKAPNYKAIEKKVKSIPDKKACFTAVGIVGADGRRYPPMIIAKGSSKRCGRIIDELIQEGWPIAGKLVTSNGWMTSLTMLEVLDYVASIRDSIKPKSEIVLVLDCYRAHLHDMVKKKASKLRIRLITVPANGTAVYQPLDIGVFGILKQYLRQAFREWLEHLHHEDDIAVVVKDGVKRFINAWEKITREHILSAWNKIPNLVETMKSKTQSLDEIYADINEINRFIDENESQIRKNMKILSKIMGKESDLYHHVGLFHYKSIKSQEVKIESGYANLSYVYQDDIDSHFDCVVKEENDEGMMNNEEEEDVDQMIYVKNDEGLRNRKLNRRSLNHGYANMDSSGEETELYKEKRSSRSKKEPELERNQVKTTNKSQEKTNVSKRIINQGGFNGIFVSISENHSKCYKRKRNYIGFYNLGSTCYMNSTLILLYHIPEFRIFLNSIPVEGKHPLLLNLKKLFQAFSRKGQTLRNEQETFCKFLDEGTRFKTYFSYTIVDNEKGTITRRGQFNSTTNEKLRLVEAQVKSQCDALNFIDFVFQLINEELESVNITYKDKLEDLMYYHTVKVYPKEISYHPPFLIIPLALKANQKTLFECIEDVFVEEVERIEGDRAVQKFCLSPRGKIQSLFGFSINRYSFSGNVAIKNCSPVIIPDVLNITKEAFYDHDRSIELQLYAVVIHIGDSLDSGHYYTYLKPVPDEQWYSFNDSSVTPAGEANFLQTAIVKQNAYIIFYKRV